MFEKTKKEKIDRMDTKKVKEEVDKLIEMSGNDINKVEDKLKGNKQYLALIKAEVEGRIGRKNGWTAFLGFISMSISILAILVSMLGLVDLNYTVCDKKGFLFPVFVVMLLLFLIAVPIFFYIGDQAGVRRVLSLIESYEKNGYLVKTITEKVNVTDNVVNNDEILSLSIQCDTCSLNIEIFKDVKRDN